MLLISIQSPFSAVLPSESVPLVASSVCSLSISSNLLELSFLDNNPLAGVVELKLAAVPVDLTKSNVQS